MLNAVSLMLLTGVFWTLVGVLFGAAPSEKDKLLSFFALNGVFYVAFVYLTRMPSAAPAFASVPTVQRTSFSSGHVAL